MPATAIKPKRTTIHPAASTVAIARCQHLRADGKRCADAVYPGHASLCHHHLNQQMRNVANGDIIAADILHSIGNFQSAAAINIALGKILLYQLTGRISRQDAMALSYQCQLLLQTLPLIQQELKETGFSNYWREETRRILGESSDLDQITFPSLLPESDVPLHPKDWVDPQSSTPFSATPQPANSQLPPASAAPPAPATPRSPRAGVAPGGPAAFPNAIADSPREIVGPGAPAPFLGSLASSPHSPGE